MSSAVPKFEVRHHDAEGMYAQKAELLAVYEQVYADMLTDPFFTPERFWERLELYARWPGFSLVTGWLNGTLIGYSLGYTLPDGSKWWQGYKGDASPEQLTEDGKRSFAVTQLMVLPQWQRRGYAHQLHDALLDGRTEERATLLVKPDNIPAKSAYLSWGWQRFGQLQPFADAPVYESLMYEVK
ncbi:GNAT family N-acetyltransferase [Amycolatopsis sp. NPDC059657]|uniref:GNAT family N-acetyltransferase n=1 Tax=Amycolatopsis sp. NPDC059657 TaxID=3346899 RepID=UPI003672906E